MHHRAQGPWRRDWMLKVTKHWGLAEVLNDMGQGINDSSRTQASFRCTTQMLIPESKPARDHVELNWRFSMCQANDSSRGWLFFYLHRHWRMNCPEIGTGLAQGFYWDNLPNFISGSDFNLLSLLVSSSDTQRAQWMSWCRFISTVYLRDTLLLGKSQFCFQFQWKRGKKERVRKCEGK